MIVGALERALEWLRPLVKTQEWDYCVIWKLGDDPLRLTSQSDLDDQIRTLGEINKAFCGFVDQCYCHICCKSFSKDASYEGQSGQDVRPQNCMSEDNHMLNETSSTSSGDDKVHMIDRLIKVLERKGKQCTGLHDNIGIVTGNWGCGAFGGDPELKAIIQWLAASQALRPFISYYTFGIEELQSLDQVTWWITSQKWSVGDLWSMLIEYSSQKLKGETNVGFCSWLLPSLYVHDPMDL